MRLQRRRFLEIDQSETRMPVATMFVNETGMCDLYRGTSIYASYQVSAHLAEGFQRGRLKCEKLTNDRRRTPSDGKSSHCPWQDELKKYKKTNNDQQNIHIKLKIE